MHEFMVALDERVFGMLDKQREESEHQRPGTPKGDRCPGMDPRGGSDRTRSRGTLNWLEH